MAVCKNCGTSLIEGKKFCPGCGARVDGGVNLNKETQNNNNNNNGNAENKYDFSDKISRFTNTEDRTSDFAPNDIANNKGMAVLSYIGLLVFIPIFAAKGSPYARFHANQGLVLFLAEIIWSAAYSILRNILYAISFTLGIIGSIAGIVSIFFLVLIIIGIVNAATGTAKRLPIIGKIILIK